MRQAGEGGCWPTTEQEWLLRAALLTGPEALRAWSRWEATVDFAKLDRGSLRLLPHVYHTLRREQIASPRLAQMKEMYQQPWYRNHLLLRHAASLIPALHAAGVDTMLLKGGALILCYYGDFGLRPMGDVDLLVRTHQAGRALEVLKELGSVPIYPLSEKQRRVLNGVNLYGGAQRHLDLHWHLLKEDCRPEADRDFWDAAIPIKMLDVGVCVLNPADQLLHACVHGLRWNAIPPFRWIADAVMIIRGSQEELDWDRLIRASERHRVILPVREAMRYLRDRMGASVPAVVIADLQRLPVPRRERLEYRASIARPSALLGQLLEYWFGSQRLTDEPGWLAKVAAFSSFLHDRWDCQDMGQLVRQIVVRAARRVREVGRRYTARVSADRSRGG